MRVDDFLSTVGIIRRRTVAKEMATNGLIQVNGRPVKASYEVKFNDIIVIKGSHPFRAEVLDVPSGSVSKDVRGRYFKELEEL
ncbi:MAG: S4 domain-containing protein [candidate division Zixibacteria bacterium]|nr:S4 domain-containing protein [candidate division Zixibacteria bacterium]